MFFKEQLVVRLAGVDVKLFEAYEEVRGEYLRFCRAATWRLFF
jgi:hypothetical protein